MDTLAIFGLQLVLSHCLRSHREVVRGAVASRETNPPGIDGADLSPRNSAFRVGVLGPRVGCPTYAQFFRPRGCLWGLR